MPRSAKPPKKPTRHATELSRSRSIPPSLQRRGLASRDCDHRVCSDPVEGEIHEQRDDRLVGLLEPEHRLVGIRPVRCDSDHLAVLHRNRLHDGAARDRLIRQLLAAALGEEQCEHRERNDELRHADSLELGRHAAGTAPSLLPTILPPGATLVVDAWALPLTSLTPPGRSSPGGRGRHPTWASALRRLVLALK